VIRRAWPVSLNFVSRLSFTLSLPICSAGNRAGCYTDVFAFLENLGGGGGGASSGNIRRNESKPLGIPRHDTFTKCGLVHTWGDCYAPNRLDVAIGVGSRIGVSGCDGKVQRSLLPLEGSDQNQTSLWYPSSGADMPVMIWIHGGGWRYGDKARVQAKPPAFNNKGFVFVSINYRLHPAVDYKAQGADVAKAIRWVQDHAKEFGGSPDRIFLMGHSAGAHLAALVATDHSYLEAEGLKLSGIKGVVLLDGAAYDIPRQIELAAIPRMKELYRTVFTEEVEKQQAASPVTHVAKGKGIPPFLILHVADRRDGKLQSESLGRKLSEAGVAAQVTPVENKTHATISGELGEPGDVPTTHIFEFLETQLRVRK
jgi:acetyl esterase/lipase